MERKDSLMSRRSFLRKSIAVPTGLVVGAQAVKMLADYKPEIGKLEINNYVYSRDFNTPVAHNTFHLELPGATEGHDPYPIDQDYIGPPHWETPIMAKIISRVEGYELRQDTRPISTKPPFYDSITPINLELSLHSQLGGTIEISQPITNELWCKFLNNYTFGSKPICLYREIPGEGLEFIADIREAIVKSGDGIARIPLQPLKGLYEFTKQREDGTFELERPYDQIGRAHV
jgi:hypothetical protein